MRREAEASEQRWKRSEEECARARDELAQSVTSLETHRQQLLEERESLRQQLAQWQESCCSAAAGRRQCEQRLADSERLLARWRGEPSALELLDAESLDQLERDVQVGHCSLHARPLPSRLGWSLAPRRRGNDAHLGWPLHSCAGRAAAHPPAPCHGARGGAQLPDLHGCVEGARAPP